MTAARIYEKQYGELPKSFESIKDYFDRELIDPYSEKPYLWKVNETELEVSNASNDYDEIPRGFRELKVTLRPHNQSE